MVPDEFKLFKQSFPKKIFPVIYKVAFLRKHFLPKLLVVPGEKCISSSMEKQVPGAPPPQASTLFLMGTKIQCSTHIEKSP